MTSPVPRGAPVPVSQPQLWAKTNRLSFITVWQKHTRLEKNPPKTTTLSWGIIQSPSIRGKQEGTASSIIQQESSLKKNRGTSCSAIVHPYRHRKNRIWWVLMTEITGEPLCLQAENLWCYWCKPLPICLCSRKHFYSVCLGSFGSRQVCKKVGPSAVLLVMSIDRLWIDSRLQGIFAELMVVGHEKGKRKLCTIIHLSLFRWLMWFLTLSVLYILFYFIVITKASVQSCDSVPEFPVQLFETFNILVSSWSFSFIINQHPHSPPHYCTLSCWHCLLKCKMAGVQFHCTLCHCMMWLCVRACLIIVCSELCPVLTSRHRGCF